MPLALIVLSHGDGDTWPVYLEDDSPRPELAAVPAPGPRIASVASWDELRAVAEERGIASHQMEGEGLAEMDKELDP